MSSLGFINVLESIVYNQEKGTTVFNVQRTAYICFSTEYTTFNVGYRFRI